MSEQPVITSPPAAETAPGIPVVVAKDVTRRYGEGDAGVDALRGVSAEFPKGQFSAIMGPSGSGKSTFMHILAGLDQPTTGSVKIDGTEIIGLHDKELTRLRRDKVGFVFQFFNLLPVLTAQENIELPLLDRREQARSGVGASAARGRRPDGPAHAPAVRALGRPAAARGDRAGAAVQARRGLRRRADRQPRLEDEHGHPRAPAAAADEFGQTIVMVTHDPRAAAIADRVLFLTDGLISRDAGQLTSDEILDQMKTLECRGGACHPRAPEPASSARF